MWEVVQGRGQARIDAQLESERRRMLEYDPLNLVDSRFGGSYTDYASFIAKIYGD